MSPYTPNELAAMDRAAEVQVDREAFHAAHQEYVDANPIAALIAADPNISPEYKAAVREVWMQVGAELRAESERAE